MAHSLLASLAPFLAAADAAATDVSHTLLQDLALVMLVAGVVTVLFHRIRQPVVLGYLMAGLIVGPHTSIPIFVADEKTVHVWSELGVILLMFSLGLHFSLRRLAGVGPTAVVAASLEIAFMLSIGYGLGRAFGWSTLDSVFLGAILSISSTTIIIKALEELKLTKKPFAELIFGILIVEDILAIALLALLSGFGKTGTLAVGDVAGTLGKLSVFLAGVLVIGLLAVPALLRYVSRFKSNEVMLVASLGLCFGVALLAAKLEYSVALGAFLIGAVIAEARERGRIEVLVAPVKDMFSAVFFTGVGMLIDPRMLAQYALPIAAITVAVVFGKVITCSVGTFLAGHDAKTSLKVGMGLAQIGEFSFIIAGLGASLPEANRTSGFLYPIAVAVSAVTTLLTPYLIRYSDPVGALIGRIVPARVAEPVALYSEWMERRRVTSAGQNTIVRRLVRKWIFQVVLNGLLMAGTLITAAALARAFAGKWPEYVSGFLGPKAAFWTMAMLVVLPLLVVTYRKIRAISMVIGETAARGASPADTATIKATVGTTIHAAGMVAVLVFLAALSWAVLPDWPVLVVLGLGLVGVLFAAWRKLERVYNKAQIALQDTFAASAKAAADDHHGEHDGTADAPPPVATMPAVLRDAVLETIEIKPGSKADGKLIRELQLRTLTGASAVAIDRPGGSVINPGPDEEMQPGDRLLLLGSRSQLDSAMGLLAPPQALAG